MPPPNAPVPLHVSRKRIVNNSQADAKFVSHIQRVANLTAVPGVQAYRDCMTRYRLHYAPDNASLVIRLALEELGVGYDTCLVDRGASAQTGASYLALNPAGRIPTLETPDGPISETEAILLWLADRHGRLGPPVGAPERAAFLNWLFYLSNTVHPDLLIVFYIDHYGTPDAVGDILARTTARLLRSFALLQNEAHPRLGGWFCGPDPSVLDLYLATMLRWVRLYPRGACDWLDLASLPDLQAMCTRLEQRQSVAALCKAEGMDPRPFTHPLHPNPPEGTAI